MPIKFLSLELDNIYSLKIAYYNHLLPQANSSSALLNYLPSLYRNYVSIHKELERQGHGWRISHQYFTS